MKKIFRNTLLALFTTLLLLQCKKEEKDIDTYSVEDHLKVLPAAAFLTSLALSYSNDTTEQGLICSNIDSDSDTFPRTITVELDTSCTMLSGVDLSGSWSLHQTGTMESPTSIWTINPSNLMHTKRTMGGSIYITPAETEGEYVVTLNSFSVTGSSSNTSEVSGKLNWKWSSGSSTIFNSDDDVFAFTGNGSGRDSRTSQYTFSIIEEIVVKGNCRFLLGGRSEIQPGALSFRTLEFGDGSCRNYATAYIHGSEFILNYE